MYDLEIEIGGMDERRLHRGKLRVPMQSSKWLLSIEPVAGFIVGAKFDRAIANRIVALPVDIAIAIPLFPEHGFPMRLEGCDDRLTKFAKPRFMLGSIGC
jgi:hypothetical protein